MEPKKQAEAARKCEEYPAPKADKTSPAPLREIGGFEKKQEPTRFGDWDVGGRCSDF